MLNYSIRFHARGLNGKMCRCTDACRAYQFHNWIKIFNGLTQIHTCGNRKNVSRWICLYSGNIDFSMYNDGRNKKRDGALCMIWTKKLCKFQKALNASMQLAYANDFAVILSLTFFLCYCGSFLSIPKLLCKSTPYCIWHFAQARDDKSIWL